MYLQKLQRRHSTTIMLINLVNYEKWIVNSPSIWTLMHLDTFNDNWRYFANSAVVSHDFFTLKFNLVCCKRTSIIPQVIINKLVIMLTRQYITDLSVYSLLTYFEQQSIFAQCNLQRIWIFSLTVGRGAWYFWSNRSRYILYFFFYLSYSTYSRFELSNTTNSYFCIF